MQDCDSKALISLREFLKQPSVVRKGITPENVHQYLTTSGVLVVFNAQSSLSKVWLCIDPSCKWIQSKKSVNDLFSSTFSHIPNISETLIRSGFYTLSVHADIHNFYMQTRMDEEGSLMSGIFLQSPGKNSYPSLDPSVNRPLEIYLFMGTQFGFADSGGLSGIAKGQLTALYDKGRTS